MEVLEPSKHIPFVQGFTRFEQCEDFIMFYNLEAEVVKLSGKDYDELAVTELIDILVSYLKQLNSERRTLVMAKKDTANGDDAAKTPKGENKNDKSAKDTKPKADKKPKDEKKDKKPKADTKPGNDKKDDKKHKGDKKDKTNKKPKSDAAPAKIDGSVVTKAAKKLASALTKKLDKKATAFTMSHKDYVALAKECFPSMSTKDADPKLAEKFTKELVKAISKKLVLVMSKREVIIVQVKAGIVNV